MTSIKYVEPPPLPKEVAGPVLPWLVVAGASGAEGARQLAAFVAALPAGLPAAVLVSLHAPPARIASLSGLLHRVSRLGVVTAYEGEALHPGVCYVADRNHLLGVAGVTAHLAEAPAPRGRNIDLLFHEAAAVGGARVIGVILAGASHDGAEGLTRIVQAGGAGLVIQAEGRAHGEMPQSASRAAGAVLALPSPDALAAEVVALLRDSSRTEAHKPARFGPI